MTDAETAQRRKWLALALLASTQFVIILDAAIVNVAIPSIGRDLKFSEENLTWIPNAYALTFGGFLLLGGRMADLLGRRRLFMDGLVLFSRRVAARRPVAAARSCSSALARCRVSAPRCSRRRRCRWSRTCSPRAPSATRRSAIWGAVSGSGGAAGVLLGGILTEYAGWEWVLWVNVPIGVDRRDPRAAPARREPPRERPAPLRRARRDHGHRRPVAARLRARRHDQRGLGLDADARRCWRSRLALLVTFVFIELRSKDPLMPFGIFRLRTLTGANLVGLLVGAALFAMFFFLSRYMQEVLGYSALKAGLSYLPLALAIIVSAGVASVLVTKLGFRPVLLAGLVLVTIGLLWFAQVPEDGVYLSNLVAPMVISAVGLGFAFVPVTIAAVSGVSKDESGLASGLINTSQQIGGALGLAVLGTIAASKTTDLLHRGAGRAGRDPRRADRGLPARVPHRCGLRDPRHHRDAGVRARRRTPRRSSGPTRRTCRWPGVARAVASPASPHADARHRRRRLHRLAPRRRAASRAATTSRSSTTSPAAASRTSPARSPAARRSSARDIRDGAALREIVAAARPRGDLPPRRPGRRARLARRSRRSTRARTSRARSTSWRPRAPRGADRVVFASTGGAIYGETDVLPTPETVEPLPMAAYGQSKFCAERYLGLYERLYGLSTIALRFGNVYGPRQDPHGEAGVIAIFCGTLRERRAAADLRRRHADARLHLRRRPRRGARRGRRHDATAAS